MTFESKMLLSAILALFAVLTIPTVSAQQVSTPVNAVHVIGFASVKDNAKGKLSVEHGQLHFARNKETVGVSASSIEDVSTGADSKKA